MKQYFILEEPRGEVLIGLLRYAFEVCDSLLLVEPDRDLSEAGQALLKGLRPYHVVQGRSGAWPGNTLKSGAATLHYYDLKPEMAQIVEGASDALYDWAWPGLPEGPYFQRKATPWLIVHQRDRRAYFEDTEEGVEALRAAVPGLKLAAAEG